MPVDDQLRKIEEHYSVNLREIGASSRAVGWKTRESQELRFAKLATVFGVDKEPVSINDYGCGYGAMLDFVVHDLGRRVSKYDGYDISAEMLSVAREALKSHGKILRLHESSELMTQADYSFASGTFNVRFDATNAAWQEFIEVKLHEMHSHSRKGFAFNLLTTNVDWEEPQLFYGDPCRWFDFCQRNFSRYVTLFHDYPLWEWTIVVRK